MKLLLINPTAPQWRVQGSKKASIATRIFRFSMLTSLTVAAAAPEGVEIRIVDEEVEPIDLDMDADLVGISFMTFNAPRAYSLAAGLRARGKTVIFGGYHPTLMPEEAAQHADAVCVGEAETNLPEMINDFRHGRLRQFYRRGPDSLEKLRIPDRRLLHRRGYAVADALQATRGCPHACTFCSVSAFHQRRFRVRPVDQVIEEMGQLGHHLIFMDDNLTADPEYAKALFAKMLPLRKRWVSQASTRIGQDPELMDLAARSGCVGLFLGLESLSDQSLNAWQKSFSCARDYSRLVSQLHGRGIAVIAGMVFGNDPDTKRVFRDTAEFLETAHIDALQATILTPFPGTPLHTEFERQGRIVDRNWAHYDFSHAVFEPLQMSREALESGHRWVLQHFYSPAAICRRLFAETRYLHPATLLRGTVPLNLGYLARLNASGILVKERPSYESPRAAATCVEALSA